MREKRFENSRVRKGGQSEREDRVGGQGMERVSKK